MDGARGRRAHDEVDVAGVELEGDPSARLVQDRGVPGHRPVPESAQSLRGSRAGAA